MQPAVEGFGSKSSKLLDLDLKVIANQRLYAAGVRRLQAMMVIIIIIIIIVIAVRCQRHIIAFQPLSSS